MIKIFNTLTEKKETLPKSKQLRLFVCGPTVYDYSHLGHARTYLNFDVIVRCLKSKGLKVFYLQNLTDIDDKIIDRAYKTKQKPAALAKKFTDAYQQDMKLLDVSGVTKYALASEFIKEIIAQIKRLEKKGFAYKTSSGVYFVVKKFKDYGKLSKQNLNALRHGYRTEPDPEKKDPLDFALWKLKKHSWEPSWKSPWGLGRPGWHIEDTAISEKFFGPQYDIHGGGLDLKFPHHEAEIAQQEAASGKKPFVKIWMHTGFLLVEGEKMSKSLNNFITINTFLKHYFPEVLRYVIISHHYRSPLDYKDELAKQAERALVNMRNFLGRISMLNEPSDRDFKVAQLIKNVNNLFNSAIEDDFNTPDALGAIFWFVNQLEPFLWDMGKREADLAHKFLTDKLALFGFELEKFLKVPPQIAELVQKRELFRTSKQFVQADALRKEIDALGFLIEDTPKGPFAHAKKLT